MKNYFIAYVLIVLIFTTGCSKQSDLDKDGYPKEFKIGISTSTEDDPQEAFGKREPLRLYLEKELNIPVRFYIVNSYAPIIEALKAKKIHMAAMSPFQYLIAHEKANVSALFYLGKANGKPTNEYISCIITRKSSRLKTLNDIKINISNLTLSFVDPASCSGHIMPNYYLKQHGINADEDFKKVMYTSNQLASVLTLYSGKVDVACTQISVIKRLAKQKRIPSTDCFNYIWISDPIIPSSYCVRNDINPKFRKKLLDAYLNIKKDTAAWGCLMRLRTSKTASTIPLDSLRYVQVDDSAYNDFRKMVKDVKGLEME